jgi:hypothetical protein
VVRGQDARHPVQDMLGHSRQLVVGFLHALALAFALLAGCQHRPLGRLAQAAQALGDIAPRGFGLPEQPKQLAASLV